MDIEFINKEKALSFNISPLMPISYLRILAQKSFNIPANLLELSYKGTKILKEHNETSLKDYFQKTSFKIIINVNESVEKNNIPSLFNSNNMKTKIIKLIKTNNKKIKSYNLSRSEDSKYEKCEECNNNKVDIFCRDDSKFICLNCKKEKHNEHKCIEIEKGNIENCFYLYKKILINEINIEEENLKNLLKTDKEKILNKKLEKMYKSISNLLEQINKIILIYPSSPVENFININCNNIRKTIYSINENNQLINSFSFKDKIKYFKELQNEDLNIDNLRKDIESNIKKYYLLDLLIEIIDKLNYDFNKFSKNIEEIRNQKNLANFQNHLNELINNQKFIFHLNEEKDEEDNNSIIYNGNLEKIYFHKEKKLEYLPIIKNNSSCKNIPILTNFKRDISKEKIKTISNKSNPVIKKNNLNNSSISFSSESSLNNFDNNNNYFSRNILYSKTINHKNDNDEYNRDSFLKLDKFLLNEHDLKNPPKKGKKRDSIRMSIFIKNKMNLQHTRTQIMKIKKRKKKK